MVLARRARISRETTSVEAERARRTPIARVSVRVQSGAIVSESRLALAVGNVQGQGSIFLKSVCVAGVDVIGQSAVLQPRRAGDRNIPVVAGCAQVVVRIGVFSALGALGVIGGAGRPNVAWIATDAGSRAEV